MKKLILACMLIPYAAAASPQDIQYRLVVARDGTGDFSSIQQAVDSAKAFPDKRITLFVKNGVYTEKVKIHEWNTSLSLVGESRQGTIITYDDHFKRINRGRNSTFFTATLQVDGDDFHAENLTIRNTAGAVGQAIALAVNADRVSFYNSDFIGEQDTLYLSGENKRVYFRDCHIEGATDFIFGRATAVFENCRLHSKADSFITAAATPEGVDYGFVFINCNLTAVEGINKVYLGRPWRPHAKTVFINTRMGAHILPLGWSPWSNKGSENGSDKVANIKSGPEAEKTVFYAEYGSTGAGANTADRVKWSQQLSKRQARLYTPENILDLKTWTSLPGRAGQ